MHHRIIGTLLGAVLLGVQGSNAEWYKVPAEGQVTFTFTEQWGIVKGTPPNTFVLGDATLVLEYADGSTAAVTITNGRKFSGSASLVISGLVT